MIPTGIPGPDSDDPDWNPWANLRPQSDSDYFLAFLRPEAPRWSGRKKKNEDLYCRLVVNRRS